MENIEEIRQACERNNWQIEGRLRRTREAETSDDFVVCEDDGFNQYTLCVDQFSDYDGLVFVVTADEQLYEFQ